MRGLIFLYILLLASNCSAEDAQITKTEAIHGGITYTSYRPDKDTQIHVLTLDPRKVKVVAKRAQDMGQGVATVAEMGQKFSALAAINGGFYKFSQTGSDTALPAGVLKIAQQWHGIAYKPRGAIGWDPDKNLVLMDVLQTASKITIDNKLVPMSAMNKLLTTNSVSDLLQQHAASVQISVLPQLNPSNAAKWDRLPFIVGGGPLLIINSKQINDYAQERLSADFINGRYSRTAVGILPNKHWVLVVAERYALQDFTGEFSGLTMAELSAFMQSLGCVTALNLDGGGSASMYVANTSIRDREVPGRAVSDALLVLARD